MMTAQLGWSLLVGTLLGVGLWSILLSTPRLTRLRLDDRLAAQLLDVSAEARRMSAPRRSDPVGTLGALLGPILPGTRQLLDRFLGGVDRLADDLRRAGSTGGVDRYRAQQAAALLGGGALGAVLALAGVGSGAVGVVAGLALPLTGALGGVVGCDRLLAHRVRARRTRMVAELPTVLEFLALSLSAGEGIHDALRRVARVGSGELSREFRGLVAEVAAGRPLGRALEDMSRTLSVPPLTRAVDQLVSALDRGAPLASVLQAQASDCREQSTRDLLEVAGKKEVGMMVPLVFLILPFTIAIAVYPGLVALQTGF